MLLDFLKLEKFYGRHLAALSLEDMHKYYDARQIEAALQSGDLICKTIYLGPDEGKQLYCLSGQARRNLYALEN